MSTTAAARVQGRPGCARWWQAPPVDYSVSDRLEGINWVAVRQDLAEDDFDNGRTPDALRRSFQASAHVAVARAGERVIGLARLLSDGVCNAYLVDVWTASSHRRQGVARVMVGDLARRVPGQHIGLQVDSEEGRRLYHSLGFRPQPEFMSVVVGAWLDNDANR